MKKRISVSNILLLLYFVLIAFSLLLICTRSSFLYPYNNWDDSNSYFTMGKSMFHNIMIYRDIFDQKGPYLYFIYGLASLISFKSFIGVFIIEVILGVIDLFFIYRILRFFIKKNSALIILPFMFAACFSSFSFYWGGCAEEICLPAMLATLYIITAKQHEPVKRPYSCREIFLAGICCGFVLCVKFTLLGFFFAFMLLVMFSSEGILRFLKSCAVFLVAMALPAVPWIIYFAVTGALADWFRVYFYTNIFVYSTFGENTKQEGLYDKIYSLSKILYWLFFDNLQYFAFIALGFIYSLFRKSADFVERITPILLFGFTFLGIYIGGAHLPYYAFPLTVFAVYGFAFAGRIIDIAGRNLKERAFNVVTVICCTAVLAGSFAFCTKYSQNSDYLSYRKEDVFLYSFAEAIEESGIKDPTLLNYNCLDCGLYTAAGIYPSCYWFQTQTLPGDEADTAQRGYIREGKTDFVVVRDDYPESINERYEEIASFHQVMGDAVHDYHLFRRIE